MTISAQFLIDSFAEGDRWAGRVRVDGHVLFMCGSSPSEAEAMQEARSCLAEHLQMLFVGATSVERQQQTERYDSLVELEAAQVLRAAAGWALVIARFHDEHIVAVFQRDWPADPA